MKKNPRFPRQSTMTNGLLSRLVCAKSRRYIDPANADRFPGTRHSAVKAVYRLREMSLSYDIPSKWLKKTPFGKASFSIMGNNLWYFAPNVPKYTNFDPEVTSFGSSRLQGIEVSAAPTSKRYGFKLNLTF